MAIQKWIRIAFANLLLVALLGVIMRYKIAYSLPIIDQKNFLQAHSHFAFTGWITQLLMTLMIVFLMEHLPSCSFKKYACLLVANLISAYGMLGTFPWEGYAVFSIAFSTLSLLVSYVFAVAFWRDLNKIKQITISHYWFKAALLFSVLSSIGTYSLEFIMSEKGQHTNWLLASIYYFLHFQYNGWFFFGCMGLLSDKLNSSTISLQIQKITFWCFALACIPAYFLSALWLPIPGFVYILVVLAALSQLVGWYLILTKIIKYRLQIFNHESRLTGIVLILSAVALSVKLLLQAGSAIPFLSHLAFGFRPVIIGYLHLVLLGVITLFLIGYCQSKNMLAINKPVNTGIIIFTAGIILNEILLLIQGFSYMNYITVPNINELLLAAALIMFSGVLLLNSGRLKSK